MRPWATRRVAPTPVGVPCWLPYPDGFGGAGWTQPYGLGATTSHTEASIWNQRPPHGGSLAIRSQTDRPLAQLLGAEDGGHGGDHLGPGPHLRARPDLVAGPLSQPVEPGYRSPEALSHSKAPPASRREGHRPARRLCPCLMATISSPNTGRPKAALMPAIVLFPAPGGPEEDVAFLPCLRTGCRPAGPCSTDDRRVERLKASSEPFHQAGELSAGTARGSPVVADVTPVVGVAAIVAVAPVVA